MRGGRKEREERKERMEVSDGPIFVGFGACHLWVS